VQFLTVKNKGKAAHGELPGVSVAEPCGVHWDGMKMTKNPAMASSRTANSMMTSQYFFRMGIFTSHFISHLTFKPHYVAKIFKAYAMPVPIIRDRFVASGFR